MSNTFADLGLPEPLVTTLKRREIRTPFPIQALTIPDMLAGHDVSGKAPTGSGKTLAFGLPVLSRVGRGRPRRPRALILAPTRELADQIGSELQTLGKAVQRSMVAVYGGVGYGSQRGRLHQGVDVLIACPGRLEDFMRSGDVNLGDVDIVVIDEADRMADMGFLPAVKRILEATSPRRQTILFSATLDGDVAVLAERYQHHPIRHESLVQEDSPGDAEHLFWKVDRADRVEHCADVIRSTSPSIVFTRTRHGADRLARQLQKAGINVVALHGGRSQPQRTRALREFTSGRAQALVATDVAARGIHVDGVASVIHFDPAEDEKAYLHRSGRTARAGATGLVVSLLDGSQVGIGRRFQKSLGMERAIEGRPATGIERGAGATVYVGNLPYAFTESDLSSLFAAHGPVESTTIVRHKGSDRSRGFGFVVLETAQQHNAIATLDGRDVRGRRLKVRAGRPPR